MDLINDNLILLNSDCSNKDETITLLANTLNEQNRLFDKDQYIKDVYNREEELPTSMGLGIAIPHAQSIGVSKTSLVFIRTKSPILWNNDEVRMIFGIAVPKENKDNEHLKILSKLARKLMDEDFRAQLLNENDKEVCANLLLINY
ncbi:MAG: PTS sugar transporter subunit IIA [Erysipelotrichaceae bacterium]|nr:PTS sugar transporter subunit IIA [Erysipelotrichaceae bacterium]